jgi:hypothetical protein
LSSMTVSFEISVILKNPDQREGFIQNLFFLHQDQFLIYLLFKLHYVFKT